LKRSAPTHPRLGLPQSPDDPILDGWYHTIELGNGMVSKGFYDQRPVIDLYGIPKSLKGMSVLDVGTGDGYFAFEMERRGAAKVVAIDINRVAECDWVPRMIRPDTQAVRDVESWKTHFEIAHTMLGSSVDRVHCNVYDLTPDIVGTFDLVFCGDLLCHLQNPMRALQQIRTVTAGMAVVEVPCDERLETLFPDQPFLRFGARTDEDDIGEHNTFWRMNTRALEDMLLYANFSSTEPVGTFKVPPVNLPVTSVIGRV
jgi:tRNA (mo5U34)-methyltransferase